MRVCNNCDTKLDHLPFKCKGCYQLHCDKCYWKENHDCPRLSKENIFHRLNNKSIHDPIDTDWVEYRNPHTIYGDANPYTKQEYRPSHKGFFSSHQTTVTLICIILFVLSITSITSWNSFTMDGSPLLQHTKEWATTLQSENPTTTESVPASPRIPERTPLPRVQEPANDISYFEGNPRQVPLTYTVQGDWNKVYMTVYDDLNRHLNTLSRSYYCDPTCPSASDIDLKMINEESQSKQLKELVKFIREQEKNPDDRARMAISLVQHIPYDYDALGDSTHRERYPYQVLADQKGLCGEKSKLLASLLKDLGYGVALLNYPEQNHQAVGIKCPTEYSVDGSGYCFVEATRPTIVTDSTGDYRGVGKLSPHPTITPISDGREFKGVSQESQDAMNWKIYNKMGSRMPEGYFQAYEAIAEKYDLL